MTSRSLRLILPIPAILLLGAALGASPRAGSAPCRFDRGNPIADQSGWYDQFKCYQTGGRHVSVLGSRSFDANTVGDGLCVIGVGRDRMQIARCGGFGDDGTIVIAFSAISYVTDDPHAEWAGIAVLGLTH